MVPRLVKEAKFPKTDALVCSIAESEGEGDSCAVPSAEIFTKENSRNKTSTEAMVSWFLWFIGKNFVKLYDFYYFENQYVRLKNGHSQKGCDAALGMGQIH